MSALAVEPELVGCETPRLFTPPLRELTPETSLGFRCIAFAEEILGLRLDPWQKWFVVHALEVDPLGRFRFRTLLLLVARQNGKTEAVKALCLWLMFTGRAHMVVGSAQNLGIARTAWESCCDYARSVPANLDVQVAKVRMDNNDPHLLLTNGARYQIAASTEDAARGIPGVDVLVMDELRTHRDFRAWGALSKITMARPQAMRIAMSNAGSDESVVLNTLRDRALAGTSPRLGLFEWSAPDGCDLDDPAAIAQANPSLGYGRHTMDAVQDALDTDPAAVFRTEVLCQRVRSLETAIDPEAWASCEDATASLSQRDGETGEEFAERRKTLRLVACLDVALDGAHATLALAAPMPDGRVRVEIAAAWTDTGALRDQLPELLVRIRPRLLGWFPAGPAAAVATTLKDKRTLPDRRVKFEEIKGGMVSAACMGLADLAKTRRILHPGDPLLDAQVINAGRVVVVDGWRFTRKGQSHVDAVYAAAGAAHMALLLPPSRGERWAGADLSAPEAPAEP